MNCKFYTFHILFFLLLNNTFTKEPSDSLSYTILRDSLFNDNPSDQIFLTTDALAESGLYVEALELLNEHSGKKNTDTADNKIPKVNWRISSGIDYYHLEDLGDTVRMSPEEFKDYKRLTEAPLSLWVRAKSIIKPDNSIIEEIIPEVFISERKSKIKTSALLSSFNGYLQYSPSIKAEKWSRSDASGESPFKPISAQPSDMGGLSLKSSINSIKENSNLRWVIPLNIDWEHYRSDRPGYESFVEYSLFPSIELRRQAMNIHLTASVEFEDYYSMKYDSLDVLRLSARSDGSIHTSKMFSFFNLLWTSDIYNKSNSIKSINRFEGIYRGKLNIKQYLRNHINIRGIYERELNESNPDTVNSSMNGKEIVVCNGFEIDFLKKLHLRTEFQWEHSWVDPNNGYFLWENRDVLEPGISIRWESEKADATLRCSFRYENIDDQFERYTSDNRSICSGGEASITPLDWLAISVFTEYQYRKYAPFGTNERISENLSVSGSITLKL